MRIFDSHCHIYPEAIAPRAIRGVDAFYGGLPAEPMDGTVNTLLRQSEALGIEKCIVHSVATKPEQVSHINQFIARSVAEAQGRFVGLGTLHPDSANVEADLEELVSLGLKGVKLHPDIQRFPVDGDSAAPIFEMCRDRGLCVLVHTGDYRYDFSNPPRVARMLQRFPGLNFIGAHFGGWSLWAEAAKTLSRYDNITVDCSSTFAWLTPEQVMPLIQAYGSHRVMFGSDYPLFGQKPTMEAFDRLPLTEAEREAIAWRNCARVFGIEV